MTKSFLFLGFGYTARALAAVLANQGWRLKATARNAEQARAIESARVEPVPWTPSGLAEDALDDVSALLVSTPPDPSGCPALVAARKGLQQRAEAIGWVGYLSSNGVYGDHKGAWVDENSPLNPSSERGFARIAAEAAWTTFGVEWSLPVIIFRLPGIYGPGRSAIDAVREGRAKRIDKPDQVFNRMHVDDIAACLNASLQNPAAGDLFNLSDDEPSAQSLVVEEACRLLNIDPPPVLSIDEAALSEMARSFYADNKRISNARMKAALGVTLKYPTYREGLAAIVRSEHGANA